MEKKETQILIDGDCDLVYSSFYILGLRQLFGKRNVKFGKIEGRPSAPRTFCFLVFCDDRQPRKINISLNDSYQVNGDVYDWCDVYGSVNANYSKTPERFHEKMVSLCPSFGVRCWNFPETVIHAVSGASYRSYTLKKYLGRHKRMLKRPVYGDYLVPAKGGVDSNYVFFLSTLWYNDEWNKNDEGVNARRANFIRACKELEGVRFEGGLVSQGSGRSSEPLFSDCLHGGIPMAEWMEKTKRSALVFNTPAFWDCHGWKLGEYLAMGKCIVSTALSNDLPAPLRHGENIHFVENDKESMKEAVDYILKHPDYREKLEKGARTYWDQYGSPVASLKLLGLDK